MDFYLNQFHEFCNTAINFIDNNLNIYGFCFGISFGLMILLITQLFIKNESKIPLFLVPSISSLIFSLNYCNIRQIQDFLDIPISIISVYLFIRCCMLMSRSISHIYDYDSQNGKPQILMISFASLTFAFYILYNTYEIQNYLVYGLNIISLIITLFSPYGFISDLSLSILYSIVAVSRSSELSYQPIISIARLSFVLISYISPMFPFSACDQEDIFLPFKVEETQTKFMVMIMLITYFISSPGLLWAHGNVNCIALGIEIPIMYSALLLYETYLDPN